MPPAGYSGTPLAKKLGVKAASVLALVDAPAGFRRALDPLPPRVRIVTQADGSADLIVWFVPSARDLHARAAILARAMGAGLWIAWPKKSSGRVTDVGEQIVREVGVANGLVDYKVCAIDNVWSALKFARRKTS